MLVGSTRGYHDLAAIADHMWVEHSKSLSDKTPAFSGHRPPVHKKKHLEDYFLFFGTLPRPWFALPVLWRHSSMGAYSRCTFYNTTVNIVIQTVIQPVGIYGTAVQPVQ